MVVETCTKPGDLVGKGEKEKNETKMNENHQETRAWGPGGSRGHRDLLHLFSWHCVAIGVQITFRCFIL